MDKRDFIDILWTLNGKLIQKDDRTDPKVEHALWNISGLLDERYGLTIQSDVIGKDDPEFTKLLRDQVPDNFCLYPFTHFQLDPDGRARPCCKYKVGDSDWQSNVPKLPEVNIEELWEQQEFQDLRDQFLRNERPKGCRACWDEEDAGIRSMRLTKEHAGKLHPFATFFHHIPRLYPKTLDLKLSNLCNLKCRICTPFLSSQWVKEIKDLQITDMGDINLYAKNSKEKFSENPENAEILKRWAPSIDYLEFYGGEPLMQQEHDAILQIINEHGNPLITGLYYNTNSTIFNEKLFEIWKPFREVVINFSIDDIGKRFEYQRFHAKWNESLSNINKYKEYSVKHGVNMALRFYVTVGILNVYYLKEFFEEVEHLNIPITLNLVHYPHHYSIVNLPNSIKNQIEKKLLTIDKNNMIHPSSLKIENIINYMYNNECNNELLKLFFIKTKQHDQYRNESFKDTFPELYALLQEYDK